MTRKTLITGASTGIGAATALELAVPGQHLFLHFKSSAEAAQKVADNVIAKGASATVLQADLSNEAGCRSLTEQLTIHTDTLDYLVNNAGGLIRRAPSDALEWSLMEDIFALNVFSAMQTTSLCLPLLRRGTKPAIVLLSSIAMRHGAPTAVIYGSAKSALDSLTRGFAKELAPQIRVNAVAPGVIDTPFHSGISSAEQFEAWKEMTPLKAIGRAEDIASAIRLCLENEFMTGETIDVNGGLFMR